MRPLEMCVLVNAFHLYYEDEASLTLKRVFNSQVLNDR